MQFSIEGIYPILRCWPNPGQTIKTSSGSMSWMTNDFDLEVKSGGMMKGLSRMFSGEVCS